MSSPYSLKPPDELDKQQREDLKKFADKYTKKNPPQRPSDEKVGGVQKLLADLKARELSVEERATLSIEAIALPLMLEAIDANPTDFEAQCRQVVNNLRAAPQLGEITRILDLSASDGSHESEAEAENEGRDADQDQVYQQFDAADAAMGWQAWQSDCVSLPCAVADVNLSTFLDQNLIDPIVNVQCQHIQNFSTLIQVFLIGEGAHVYEAADKLVELFATHSFDPCQDDLCNVLYCWDEVWRRNPYEKRRLLLAECGLGSVADGANTSFAEPWNALVAEFSDYMDAMNSTDVHKARNERVCAAAWNLLAYIDSTMTAEISMRIKDCAAQLIRAIEILKNDEVLKWFAGGNGNMWSVIVRILNGSVADLKSNIDAAKDIRVIFNWLDIFPSDDAMHQLNDPQSAIFSAMERLRQAGGVRRGLRSTDPQVNGVGHEPAGRETVPS